MDVLLRAPMPEASAAPVAEGGCYARLMQFCSNFLNATYDGQKLSSVTIHGLPKQPIALEGCGTDRAKEVNLDEGGNWGKRNRHAGAISDAKRAEITGVMRDFRSKVLAAYPRCESRGTRVLLRTNPITDETIRAWKEDASEPNSAMRVLDYALP